MKAEAGQSKASAKEKVVWNFCSVNCEARCPLLLHVKNDRITRVETDNTGDDKHNNHQVRACLRGRSMRKRVYAPERLKYPMKRVGKRGEGKFERISWDEAYELIGKDVKRVKEKYGNEAFYIHYGTGAIGGTVTRSFPSSASPIARLMNLMGGYLNFYGDYSVGQNETALPFTYGTPGWVSGNSITDIVHSKLVVLFGHNYSELRISGGSLNYEIQRARAESNTKLVIIDPRYSDSVANYADQWIPIRPGTDAAFISAMAYVMITENLVDQKFIDKYSVGYDEDSMPAGIPAGNSYKSYILGKGKDQTPKTPEWAAKICGFLLEILLPVSTLISIERLKFLRMIQSVKRL